MSSHRNIFISAALAYRKHVSIKNRQALVGDQEESNRLLHEAQLYYLPLFSEISTHDVKVLPCEYLLFYDIFLQNPYE